MLAGLERSRQGTAELFDSFMWLPKVFSSTWMNKMGLLAATAKLFIDVSSTNSEVGRVF